MKLRTLITFFASQFFGSVMLVIPIPQASADSPYQQIWAHQVGTFSFDSASEVATDAGGNVYFAPDLVGPAPDGRDVHLTKYDSAGTALWSQHFGSTGEEFAGGLATDSSGGVFVGGGTTGSLDGPNAGSPSSDAFVRRYDSAGNLLWSKQFGTSGDDAVHGAATDIHDNVIVGGSTAGNLFSTKAGGDDAFLSKFTSAGTLLWSRQFGTSNNDKISGVATDKQDNIYISGSTGYENLAPRHTYSDAFVAKYDSAGNLLWYRQFGNAGIDDSATGVAVDSLGNAFVSGYHLRQFGGRKCRPTRRFPR
jgi:hypothetical protein